VSTTALAVIGVALVSGIFESGGTSGDLVGIAASSGAGACYAIYTVAAAQLIEGGLARSRTMGLMFGLAALIALPWWLATDLTWLFTTRGAVAVLWLGAGATALAYLLIARGLGRLPTPTVATLTLAEPLTATLLGTLVLRERPSTLAIAGIVVLGAALVALARSSVPPTPSTSSRAVHARV
jgi:DME family drug/metabolite transporter